MNSCRLSSLVNVFLGSALVWLAGAQVAAAQAFVPPVLIAQTGTTKTAIGWGIVVLCVGLGLLVVCRPSIRNPKKKPKAQAKK